MGSCPEASDLKQDEGYTVSLCVCVQRRSREVGLGLEGLVGVEKAASWQDIWDRVPSSVSLSPAQLP